MKKNILLFMFLGISVCVSSQDKDKDGVLDLYDECVNSAGAKENKGCPWGDQDKDGVLDNLDKCPFISGIASREGCPIPIIDMAGYACVLYESVLSSFEQSIEFDFNKFNFTDKSLGKLGKIVLIMEDYPKSKFTIKGFIDDKEKRKRKEALAEKRVEVIYDYLVSKGIAEERLLVFGKGAEYHSADNNTKGERAQNRRVEIKLLK